MWAEFFTKLKESIVNSFEYFISHYEEEIRKLDSTRMYPGWNYCHFFLMKEGLAFTYEQVNLCNDSLKQYLELDAVLEQNIAVNTSITPTFDKFGGNEISDEQVNIIDTYKKPYRQLIYLNTISEFDFSHYLFARKLKVSYL